MRQLIVTLMLALLCPLVSAETQRELELRGTLLRLQGDFDSALEIQDALIRNFQEPAGHTFALSTLITHLTWDETLTEYDEALLHHADQTFAWCEPILAEDERDALANYYCGQADFALSYYYGLKGNYFTAGRHGTRSIELLEQAIATDPSLVDAKMYLGVAYFIADNLPPFIRMFSRFLWFIPTGNSEKSLPYIREVMDSGDIYPDVARYIYSFLLLEGEDETLRDQAAEQLEVLVTRYPENFRFQLRWISMLLLENRFEDTIRAATRYIEDVKPEEPFASLTQIWQLRSHMALDQMALADKVYEVIRPVFTTTRDELPGWSVTWYLLTEAQLLDLNGERQQARAKYRETLEFAKSTYVSERLLEAARAGLKAPYQPQTNS